MRAVLLALAACGGAAPRPQPPSVDVRAEVAQAEQAEKARRHDLAKIHYEKAIAGAKDNASIGYANREYAETLATWGEFPAALRHLETALAARPKDPGGWNDLGLVKHKLGDDQGAVTALETSRTQAPKDPRPRVALAALRWKLGDRAGAEAEYRQLLELDLPTRLRNKIEWALRELAKP